MNPSLRTEFQNTAGAPAKPVRTSKTSKGSVSVTIRMSPDERTQLDTEAGQRTLSAYIRSRLFGAKGKRGPDRRPSFDSACLARLLGVLGQSNLVPNMEALAVAARTGTLEDGPELLSAIRGMKADLAKIRRELMCALGVKPD